MAPAQLAVTWGSLDSAPAVEPLRSAPVRQLATLKRYLKQNNVSKATTKRVCRNAKHAISGDLTPESVAWGVESWLFEEMFFFLVCFFVCFVCFLVLVLNFEETCVCMCLFPCFCFCVLFWKLSFSLTGKLGVDRSSRVSLWNLTWWDVQFGAINVGWCFLFVWRSRCCVFIIPVTLCLIAKWAIKHQRDCSFETAGWLVTFDKYKPNRSK